MSGFTVGSAGEAAGGEGPRGGARAEMADALEAAERRSAAAAAALTAACAARDAAAAAAAADAVDGRKKVAAEGAARDCVAAEEEAAAARAVVDSLQLMLAKNVPSVDGLRAMKRTPVLGALSASDMVIKVR